MTTNVMERLLETFFRRWWLNIVPLLLCCGLGVMTVLNQPKQYLSQGVLSAAPDSLIANLSSVSLDNGFVGFETPATVASQRINEQLRSDEFVLQLADRAGLQPSIDAGLIGPDFVRQRVGASPDGENLLKVGSMTEDPELSVRLATSAIDTFIQSVIDEDLSDSKAAQTFYEGVAADYRVIVDAARDALNEYLVAHPEPLRGERPLSEQAQITRLTDDLDRANSRYTAAQSNVEEAKLANELALLDVTQRLRVIDPPSEPVVPVSGLKSMVSTFGVFALLGIMLTAGLVTLTTFLDKTIRTADEVSPRLAVGVVATVPAVALRKLTGGH